MQTLEKKIIIIIYGKMVPEIPLRSYVADIFVLTNLPVSVRNKDMTTTANRFKTKKNILNYIKDTLEMIGYHIKSR